MRTLTFPLLASLFASSALAVPTENKQAVLDGFGQLRDLSLNSIVAAAAETVSQLATGKWMTEGKKFSEQNGLVCASCAGQWLRGMILTINRRARFASIIRGTPIEGRRA
jgi:hypothetical protein